MTDRQHARPVADPTGRRGALRAIALGIGGVLTCQPAWSHDLPAVRRLTLHNTHTMESLSVDYASASGYHAEALVAINRLLRDHRNGEVHAMDPALLDLLHAAAVHADREPEFEVISGYRSPATNAMLHEHSHGVAAHSLHIEGRAIDVRLAGCDIARLRDIGLALGRGGVGYYRASGFVHLDTGRPRTWAG